MLAKQAGILVVEPVPMVATQIASLLKSEQIERVACVSDPTEALKLLELKPCHLIFSDWRFTNGSGLEFLKKIRAHSFPRIRNIGFVVLTADGRRSSVEAAIEAGADDYIVKPLNENQLRTRITSLLMKIPADQ